MIRVVWWSRDPASTSGQVNGRANKASPSNGNGDSKDHRLKITFSSGDQCETPGTNRLASHAWAGEETVLFEFDKDDDDTLDFVNAALNL